MTEDIWEQFDPESGSYFAQVANAISSDPGYSPVWAAQWTKLAQAAAHLEQSSSAAIASLQSAVASLQADDTKTGYGAAQISAGSATVTVTHGLAGTPAIVIVTPSCDISGAVLWVSGRDSTSFTVSLSVATVAAATFDWLAALP